MLLYLWAPWSPQHTLSPHNCTYTTPHSHTYTHPTHTPLHLSIACNFDLSDRSGTIISPGYPTSYLHSQNCRWTIHQWPNHHLNITLHHLDIVSSNKCQTDYLKLEPGHFPHQRRLCGYHQNIVFNVNETVKLRFRSRQISLDLQHNYSGFKLLYEQVPSSELDYFDLNYVRVNGRYVEYKRRLWIR